MRVIASSIRKGNIIEREDGQLCVVLSAESFHPGKGTPTTQIDMRRLSDGVKVTDRFKTTEQVERAFVEDKNFDYLYGDADGYHFMNTETYDQIQVPSDVIGDQAQWLQEGMKVIVSLFNDIPVGIQLPPRVTLEIIETEPAMKGQTASSSYKPAKASNGARRLERGDHALQGVDGDRAVGRQRPSGSGIAVIDDARVPVAHQPAHDIGAHPAQSDHAQLHHASPSGCEYRKRARRRRRQG